METVFLAAAAFELDILSRLSADQKHYTFATFGIGALSAAKSLPHILPLCRDKNVVIVGTCGDFDAFDRPRLVTPHTIKWLPTGERVGAAYTIRGTAPDISIKKAPPWLRYLPTATVYCSPTISLKEDGAKELLKPAVENVELYSIASEIQNACRSLAIVLATTNAVGPSAHAQWQEHRDTAAQLYANFILENLNSHEGI